MQEHYLAFPSLLIFWASEGYARLFDGEVQEALLLAAGRRICDLAREEAPGASQEAVHALHAVRVPHLQWVTCTQSVLYISMV